MFGWSWRPGVCGTSRVQRWIAAVVLVVAVVAAGDAAGSDEQRVSVSAVDQEWGETLADEIGQVQILYQDIKIQCDEMELDRKTMDLSARGNVVLDQGPRRLSADEMHYNLRDKTGVLTNAQADAPPYYHVSGAVIEKIDETRFRIEQAKFTTCEVEPRPPWMFKARRALIEEEGYGYFWGTSLRVKDVPLLYVPYIFWPVKQERAAGMLVPAFGYGQRLGAYLGLAYYIPLGRSYDTTAYLDMYSDGWLGLGSEWRWTPRQGSIGDIDLFAIRDKDTGEIEWKVQAHHLENDLLGFRLIAEIDQMSDIDFFQEFELSFDRSTMRSLYSYVYMTQSWGPYALNLRADHRQTVFSSSSSEVVLAQYPEAELRVRPTRIGRSTLYWDMVSSVSLLAMDRSETLSGNYARADLYPSLSYTLPGPPWLTVTPRLGGRATYYTAQYDRNEDNQTVLADEPLQRTFLEGGFDLVGPSVSRVFNRQLGSFEKLKHVIEPRVAYTYVSDIDADVLASVPRFDEVDSTRIQNRVLVALVNRLFARSAASRSARELGSLELFQEHSFSEPLNWSSDRSETSQRGPLGANLRITPSSGLGFDIKATYDTLFKGIKTTSLAAALTPGPTSTRLTWYQSFRPETGERASSQIRALFGFRKSGFPLRFDLHLAYDVEQQEFQQQRLRMYYQGSCWGVALEYRDLRVAAYPTRDYRITIDFSRSGAASGMTAGISPENPPGFVTRRGRRRESRRPRKMSERRRAVGTSSERIEKTARDASHPVPQ